MEEMKIIELLTLIANGQKVPKKITYSFLLPQYKTLVYDEEEQEYRYENDYESFWRVANHHLNNKVQILSWE